MSQPTPSAETTTLLRYLNGQRRHVLGILEELDEDALRRPILPSGWTCLGLVNHLALDVERFWFRAVVAGEQSVIDGLDATPDPWRIPPHVPAATIFDLYRQETALADAIISATPPDTPPAWWPPDLFGNYRLHTLREIILHVMTETATHAGHLDAARELIDRRQWRVLTD
jgi:uncharacterized damage-inducible protein DinB